MNEQQIKVPKRILNTLLASLSAGVVPRVGAPYIAIGRNEEIGALLDAMDTVAEGGATVRFLIGRYGSGKSFLIQLIRGHAMERGFLCADADLSTDQRRLCGGNGAGRATYRELLRNLASKASPDGGALPLVLARHMERLLASLREEGCREESPRFREHLMRAVQRDLSPLEGCVGGFDFSRVLTEYFLAEAEGEEGKKSSCLKWLRGEYTTKTEAKAELGFRVSSIVDDENWYDFIKLWALYSRHVGYLGLIVYIDECIILYKIVNRISRESNYEKLLTIFNDTLQGRAEGLGVIFGGTPQFLEDSRRGLYSYEALRSRLADSRFAESGFVTFSSPVLRLRRLSDNELYALIKRLSRLYAQSVGGEELLSEEQMQEFLRYSLSRVGASEQLTPREMIRDFLTLLQILHDNEAATFEGLLYHSSRSVLSSAEQESTEDVLSLPDLSDFSL